MGPPVTWPFTWWCEPTEAVAYGGATAIRRGVATEAVKLGKFHWGGHFSRGSPRGISIKAIWHLLCQGKSTTLLWLPLITVPNTLYRICYLTILINHSLVLLRNRFDNSGNQEPAPLNDFHCTPCNNCEWRPPGQGAAIAQDLPHNYECLVWALNLVTNSSNWDLSWSCPASTSCFTCSSNLSSTFLSFVSIAT